jgi:predicted nucleic acid-binding protein
VSPAVHAGVPEDVVVLDTDVYSQLYVRHGATVAAKQALKDVLVGRSVAIAVQTRAELLIWPGVHGWSADRAGRLRDQLDNTPTVPVDERVIEAFVRITVDCRRSGHALGQKQHVADRWVAATAIAISRPLLTGDGIYLATPGLELLRIEPPAAPSPNPK